MNPLRTTSLRRPLQMLLAALSLSLLPGCRMNGAKRLWSDSYQVVGRPLLTTSGLFLLDEGRSSVRAIGLDGVERWTAQDRGFAVWDTSGLRCTRDEATVVVISRSVVSALRADTGQELWTQRIMASPNQGENLDAELAAIADGMLITTGFDLRATAIRVSTGERVWRVPRDSKSHDVQALRVVGDAVITQSDNDVMAHDLATGKQRWVLRLAGDFEDGMNRGRHALRALPDSLPGNVVPVVGPDRIVGIDVATGVVVYHIATTGRASYSVTTEGLLVADGYGLRGYDPGSGAERWTQARPGTKWVTNLALDQALLQVDHEVCAVALRDGKMSGCQSPNGMPEPDRPRGLLPNRVVLFTGHATRLFTFQGGALRSVDLPSPPLRAFAEPYQVAMAGNLVAIRWKGNDVSMYEVK